MCHIKNLQALQQTQQNQPMKDDLLSWFSAIDNNSTNSDSESLENATLLNGNSWDGFSVVQKEPMIPAGFMLNMPAFSETLSVNSPLPIPSAQNITTTTDSNSLKRKKVIPC